MDKPKEYCGVFGIYGANEAAQQTYLGLHALQHRGQESAGIVATTFDEKHKKHLMLRHAGMGKVLDVFDDKVLREDLHGSAAIGHNRYSTSGSSQNEANIQPFLVTYKSGQLALAHNGNLSNARQLREMLTRRGTIFQSTTDSECILHLIAQSPHEDQIDQIQGALRDVEGAYCLVMLTHDKLIAVRDPNGFRPLAIGKLDKGDGNVAYCVASETCAFDIIGAEYVRDVEPGEIVVIGDNTVATGDFGSYRFSNKRKHTPCVFEYIYFSRPDSMIFGEMTDKVRRKIGKQLAIESLPPRDERGKRVIVISVPDSSNTATLGYVHQAHKLKRKDIRYEIGLIRNHYVGRTFISPGQDSRERKVRSKFNTVRGVLKDRIVTVVDDSIVRGTTLRLLIRLIREAGARQVHIRITSPPVMHPCFYGMDFPTQEELLVSKFMDENGEPDINAMGAWLGADSLHYLSVDGLRKAVLKANRSASGFCHACFTADYPVPVTLGVRKEEND
ncbi:MAG: amidophosphoribosyltransferase [Bacteroidota bacterium]